MIRRFCAVLFLLSNIAGAFAQGLSLPWPGPGGGAAFGLTFINGAVDPTDLTVYTFNCGGSGCSLGPISPLKYVLVGTLCRRAGSATPTVNTVAVDGQNASLVGSRIRNIEGSNVSEAAWWLANLTADANANGNIVVTASDTMSRCAIAWYYTSGVVPATFNVVGATTGTACAMSVNVTVPTKGSSAGITLNTGTAVSWGGTLNEDIDGIVETGIVYSAAHLTPTPAGSKTITATATGCDTFAEVLAGIGIGP